MPYTETWVPSNGFEPSATLRVKDWTRTPNWNTVKKLKNKDLPVNPYNQTVCEVTQTNWNGHHIYHDGNGNLRDDYFLYANNQPVNSAVSLFSYGFNWIFTDLGWSDISSLKNQAFLNALLKASDAKTNLAVTLAEASKTSSLILDRATRIFKSFRAFKKGRFREAATELGISPKNVHNTWLEYQYGWRPLLKDIKDSAEFFAQQSLGGRPPSFVVTGKASRSTNAFREYDMGFNPILNCKETVALTASQTVKVKLWLEIDNPQFQNVAQLGLTNPLSYAWEVVPFSFVFDWFVSVGDYLQGLTALHGITVKRSMWDGFTDWKFVAQIGGGSYATTSDSWSIANVDQNVHSRHYQRGPFTVDLLSLRPPINSPCESFRKLTSSMALLRTQAQRWAR